MNTDSDQYPYGIPAPYAGYLGKDGAVVPPDRPETWKGIPGFGAYEASDKGRIRSVDRMSGARSVKGVPLKPWANNRGYLMVKPTGDDGAKRPRTVHTLVLLTFAGPCPAGQESRHLDDDPLNNWWPENLAYGTKKENAADKFRNGGQAPTPKAYECVNYARCGGMVANAGSRCLPCVEVVGNRAAVMLNAGLNLDEVTRRLDYQNPKWVWTLAVKHGGYAESLPHAQSQQPSRPHRVTTTLRAIFRRGLRDGS